MSTRDATIPVARLAPILQLEITKRKTMTPGVSCEHGGGLEPMLQEIEAATGSDRLARRIYTILHGKDTHGLRRPLNYSEPVITGRVGVWRVLVNNDAVIPALRTQAALDSLDVFCGREAKPQVTLTRGVAYRYVLDRKLQRTVTHVRFDTADAILSALGRPDYWAVELADLYEAA